MRAGRRLAKYVISGTVVCLSGALGSGKTTFIKGLAAGLGLKDALRRITSSSFILVREFPEKNLVHIDLFRIGGRDFYLSGLDQYISDSNIVAIEWPDAAGRIKARKVIKVGIRMAGGNKRSIRITGLK